MSEQPRLKLYDAHNHLQDERFGGCQAQLMADCTATGLARMVVNGSCEDDWPAVLALARQYPRILPSFGCHPWYVHQRSPHWESALTWHLGQVPSAVGEIGLDRWKPGLDYASQEEAFLAQLRIAAKREIPVSIHCLQAWGRMLHLLSAGPRPARGFLLHSYGGSSEMITPFVRLGACFSFPGYFLHERKARQQETFRRIPLDRLLVETDAPDQPLPASGSLVSGLCQSRLIPLMAEGGQRLNHPANLAAVYEGLARLLGVPLEDLAGIVEENFHRLFNQG